MRALPCYCCPLLPCVQKLLDDLESEVDKGNSNLKRETARVELTTKQARTCWLYTTICILLVVLIALVLAKWH